MQYLCLVHVDGELMAGLTPAEGKALTRESLDYDVELQRSGVFVAANALQGPETAAVTR